MLETKKTRIRAPRDSDLTSHLLRDCEASCSSGRAHDVNKMRLPAVLTPSTSAISNCCCSKGIAPYRSNPPFLIFDIRALMALSPERQSARMSKIKNGGLDQYMAKCKALTGSAVKGLNRRELSQRLCRVSTVSCCEWSYMWHLPKSAVCICTRMV